ncbi:MAG TPA: hypothetical protein DIU45_08320 [Clostridium sp.]|nr:hypothetical protein [Clostridium sp.]
MDSKNILYTVLAIVLIIVLGPSILSVLGIVISGIFTLVMILLLVIVLAVAYWRYKFNKSQKEFNKNFKEKKGYTNNPHNTTSSHTSYSKSKDNNMDYGNSTIIDVEYEDAKKESDK